MKYRIAALFSLATALVLTPAAQADSFTYDLQSSDSTVTLLTLTFTTAPGCSGVGAVCNITGVSGTLIDTNFLSAPESITSFASGTGLNVTSDGLFLYDNLINPDGTNADFAGSVLDGIGGVVFDVSGATPLEVSLSGGGAGTYFLNESPDGMNVNYGGLGEELQDVTPVVPEPSPMLLMGTGLLILAIAGRKLAPKLQAVKVSS